MSTLRTINIIHPSGSTTNVVNDSSGNITVGGGITSSSALDMGSSFKRNRILNGNMLIDQRNAGASTTPAASGYLVDRFAWLGSLSSKLTFGQNLNSVTPPSGFTKYLGAQTASATTPGASEFYSIYQVIEGFNMADFGWGSANAKTITLSFVVYSSLTGTFGGSIYNGAANRCYPFSYSVPAANTWTTISLTVAGDTTGTWATDNTAGAIVMFGLGAGASVSGTAGAWGSTLYRSSTGAVQVVATASATFYITGVQLEVGTKATPYEMQIYSDQLAQCQRYYEIGYAKGWGYSASGNVVGISSNFEVTKRATPTVALSSSTYTNATSLTLEATTTWIGIPATASTTGGFTITAAWTASAEL